MGEIFVTGPFSFTFTHLAPSAYSKDCDHEFLLKVHTYSRKFIWYDLKTRTYEDAEIPRYQRLFDAYTFAGSLVSPKLKTKRIKNVIKRKSRRETR